MPGLSHRRLRGGETPSSSTIYLSAPNASKRQWRREDAGDQEGRAVTRLLGAANAQLPRAEVGKVTVEGTQNLTGDVRPDASLAPGRQHEGRGAKRSMPTEHLSVPSSKL